MDDKKATKIKEVKKIMTEDEEDAAEKAAIEKERSMVHKCKLLESQAKEARRKWDWEWTVRQLYVRGYHYAKYNRSTSTVVFSTKTGVRISINLVAAHLRGVRNQITSFQPKWEVLPRITSREAFANARYSGKVLDYTYEKAHIKRKIKEVVNDALIYSIGIWQFDVNKKNDVVINRVDPFDFYVDPNISSADINDPEYGAEYVILTHRVPLEVVKKNKNFKNTEMLDADNEIASAEYKRFLYQVTRNSVAGSNKEVNQTVLLRQAWIRERQDNGDFKIRLVTYIEGNDLPLSNELTDETEYPFEVIQGDINGGEFYSEAWIKHLIPINRIIDSLESHIFEYNHMYARGRYVVDKNSGVRLIVNQHGQIIEKNRGSTVTPLPISPLPSTPMEQLNSMKRHLEDLSGVHEVSLGRFPGTLRSGTAIAELKQSDATNQADLVDNLEDFLSRAGRKILKLISESWNTTKLITATGATGKPEYFMAIGEKGALKKKDKFSYGDQELPLAVIGAENEVRVQVGSWLAYTKEARLEKLKEFYRLGIIDQQSVLQHAEFADIDGILERSREERIFQQMSGAKNQQIEKEYGIQLGDEELALAENEIMLEGIEQHAEPKDDHDLHNLIHKDEGDNPLVRAHMAEHERLKKWQGVMDRRPLGPQMGQPGGELPPEGMPPEMGMGGIPPGGPSLPPPPGPPTPDMTEPFIMRPAVGPGINL